MVTIIDEQINDGIQIPQRLDGVSIENASTRGILSTQELSRTRVNISSIIVPRILLCPIFQECGSDDTRAQAFIHTGFDKAFRLQRPYQDIPSDPPTISYFPIRG